MNNNKPNRKRNILIRAFVDEDELAQIESNMKRAKIKKKSDYIRQMCVFGKVIYIDDLLFRKCYDELHRIGVNLNQMSKYLHSSGSIYKEDIDMVKESYLNIVQISNGIYLKIDELINAVRKSGFETLSEKIRRIYKEKMEK